MTSLLLKWNVALWCLLYVAAAWGNDAPPADAPAVLARALAGPLGQVEQVVFAVRLGYNDPHWYANIGYFCDDENRKAYAGNGQPDVGKLCLLHVPTRSVTILFDAQVAPSATRKSTTMPGKSCSPTARRAPITITSTRSTSTARNSSS